MKLNCSGVLWPFTLFPLRSIGLTSNASLTRLYFLIIITNICPQNVNMLHKYKNIFKRDRN
jgi:hypothetical protein